MVKIGADADLLAQLDVVRARFLLGIGAQPQEARELLEELVIEPIRTGTAAQAALILAREYTGLGHWDDRCATLRARRASQPGHAFATSQATPPGDYRGRGS